MSLKNQLTTSDHLPYEEYQRLLACLRADKEYMWEAYAKLSFCTACRASDVLPFKWGDLLGKAEATITEQKTGKTRRIRINPSVQRDFHELHALMGSPDSEEYIFRGRKKNAPVTIQYVNQKLKEFKEKYKLAIDNFSTHTFRKTFGRYVYESHNRSAESLILLNKILNHTSIQITKTYIGITQSEINSIFDSIRF